MADRGAHRLLTLIIAVAGGVPAAILVWLGCTVMPWCRVPAAAVAVGTAVMAYLYPRRFAATLYGTVDACAVTVHSGVWWKREMRLPLSQLRTFECWTFPLGRILDCSVVVLRFAGGSVWIPLIPCEQAERLTRLLSEGSL